MSEKHLVHFVAKFKGDLIIPMYVWIQEDSKGIELTYDEVKKLVIRYCVNNNIVIADINTIGFVPTLTNNG